MSYKYVLKALITGATLKVHRHLDGSKIYQLHPLNGSPEKIDTSTVDVLKRRGFIDSNKKFPAATYLLTEKGRRQAQTLGSSKLLPLSAKNYGQ